MCNAAVETPVGLSTLVDDSEDLVHKTGREVRASFKNWLRNKNDDLTYFYWMYWLRLGYLKLSLGLF